MFRCALFAILCLWMLSPQVLQLVAEEIDPPPVVVFPPPPAPAEWVPVFEPADKPVGISQIRIPAETPAPAAADEPVLVPRPESILESAPEPKQEAEQPNSGISINIGPQPGDAWPKLADFSDTRYWPSVHRTQWTPGHRDRFGMFSLTGEHAYPWKNWNGLSSLHGHGFHFLNGPVRSDLPSKLFDFTWGLHWSGEVTDGWSASLSGRVGLFTDFEDSVRDGWRFPAHAIVFHDWTDDLRGVAGVKYLDRENVPVLPVLGLILRPDDRVRVEAIFPEPRIAWRVHAEEGSENWLSLSGEIGGGEWAIERSNTDLADVVTYNEYSAVIGFHHYNPGNSEQTFEIGYTFARDLEYRSGVGDFSPEDTFFIRMSGRF